MDKSKGVGPHPLPWPQVSHYDTELLKSGDHRNVMDQYRYWSVEAIKDHLDRESVPIEIAIENVDHDFNIGTIVRTANAMGIRVVHIIGQKHWNRRGAMVTDAYMHLEHHKTAEAFIAFTHGRHIIAVDNVEGAVDMKKVSVIPGAILVFGSEGNGVSETLLRSSETIMSIAQYGSTRSMNVAIAAGIVMYEWTHSLRSL